LFITFHKNSDKWSALSPSGSVQPSARWRDCSSARYALAHALI
jgi:hypothetical protein